MTAVTTLSCQSSVLVWLGSNDKGVHCKTTGTKVHCLLLCCCGGFRCTWLAYVVEARQELGYVHVYVCVQELEGSNLDCAMAQHLLVAADRFQLPRLRRICERRLCETVEVPLYHAHSKENVQND